MARLVLRSPKGEVGSGMDPPAPGRLWRAQTVAAWEKGSVMSRRSEAKTDYGKREPEVSFSGRG